MKIEKYFYYDTICRLCSDKMTLDKINITTMEDFYVR
jgi:hypothetical protein